MGKSECRDNIDRGHAFLSIYASEKKEYVTKILQLPFSRIGQLKQQKYDSPKCILRVFKKLVTELECHSGQN